MLQPSTRVVTVHTCPRGGSRIEPRGHTEKVTLRWCPWDEAPVRPDEPGPYCPRCAAVVADVRTRTDLAPILVTMTTGEVVADAALVDQFVNGRHLSLLDSIDFSLLNIRDHDLPLKHRALGVWVGEVDERVVILPARDHYPTAPFPRLRPVEAADAPQWYAESMRRARPDLS